MQGGGGTASGIGEGRNLCRHNFIITGPEEDVLLLELLKLDCRSSGTILEQSHSQLESIGVRFNVGNKIYFEKWVK